VNAYLVWAGSSLGLAAAGCLAVGVLWLGTRWLGVRRWTARDLVLAWAIVFILVLTLRPGMLVQFGRNWQLLPFGDLLDALPRGTVAVRLALAEIAANVLLFLPLGIALSIRSPGLPVSRVVLMGAALSLAVELLQGAGIAGRTAQVTDVLMNTLGTWLGWQLIGVLRRAAAVSVVARRRR
jgi:glycopeptide antibiotics resistance protein